MKSLKEYKSLILKYELPYRSFNSTELTDLYMLHNETFNTNKKDIGCHECREEILKDLYLYYKKDLTDE